MIVDSMALSMGSARSYRSEKMEAVRFQKNTGVASEATSQMGNLTYFSSYLKAEREEEVTRDMENSMLGKNKGISKLVSPKEDEDLSAVLRRQTLLYLLNHLHQIMGARSRNYLNGKLQSLPSGNYSASGNQAAFHYEKETEETAFACEGTLRTKDGREISFSVSLAMSRSFEEAYYEEYQEPKTVSSLIDPLVINYNTSATSLSDQKFFFDLDCDGKKEGLSALNKGSGFLAYDRNGDGIINDGSELFGTSSGDGFANLAAYDEDGNGFIDEGDSLFQKLKIWTKDEKGKDILLSLKELGIGALCLSKAATSFSLNHLVTNETKGVIRSTGIFLYENGNVGTMQQVDLAAAK